MFANWAGRAGALAAALLCGGLLMPAPIVPAEAASPAEMKPAETRPTEAKAAETSPTELKPAEAASPATEPAKVLLLYDSLAKGTAKEGNVAVLQRLFAAYRVQATTMSMDRYEKGAMHAYPRVAFLINLPDVRSGNAALAEDAKAYAGMTMQIGGDITGRKPDVHIPSFESGVRHELAMADALQRWLGAGKPGRAYVLVHEIYPFSDLSLLEYMADRLYESGIPFMAGVRPVLHNADSPAMTRYAETMRRVQEMNGSIVIRAPVVQENLGLEGAALKRLLADFISVLARHRVAPLGIAADLHWSYDRIYAEDGMGFFRSSVLFPDERPIYLQRSDTSSVFASSLYSIRLEDMLKLDLTARRRAPFPMDTAITIEFDGDKERLDAFIRTLIDSRLPFADYRDIEHEVRNGEHVVSSARGDVFIDGALLLPVDDTTSAGANIAGTASGSLDEAGRPFWTVNAPRLIVFVAFLASLIILSAFLVVGRRLYKRKFLN